MAEENQHTKLSQEQPSEPSPILPRNTVRKMEWHELVGLTAEEAERKIKEVMPMAQIQVVQPNCFVTTDFNLQRVRLYVDSSGKIERPPKTG